MSPHTYEVRAKVWLYPGEAAWHFLSVPKEQSMILSERYAHIKRGWGSLPVMVTIGQTTWKTSIFPDKKSGCYLLPLKAQVRKKEHVKEGDAIDFSLEVIVDM